MFDIGLPPEYERQKARSVSSLTFHHVSRSSTPGISFLDGTPLDLYTSISPPRRSRSTSDLDMAIKLTDPLLVGHQDFRAKLECLPSGLDEAPVASVDPPEQPPKTELHQDERHGQVPSLSDLAQLLRIERYQRRYCLKLTKELHQAHLGAARTSRLLHISRTVQRTLGECVKAEDKHSFVNLFNAFHDAISGCFVSSAAPSDPNSSDDYGRIGYPACFLDKLPGNSRALLLDFVSKVRHDGHFIAERLISLSHRDLEALLPGRGQAKSSDSIFGSSQRHSSRTSRHLGFVADGQTELLASLEFGSPLETLVLAVRGLSSVPLHRDDEATDVWSTVCANLILQQKPGSEKLVPAVIQLWASSCEWPGKERLGQWMFDILQRGTPLLEQVHKQNFRVRSGLRNDLDAQDDQRIEAFYQESVDSLLALVADPAGASVIPEGARTLCLAICQKLGDSSTHRQAFPNFVLTRWLFTSFLPDVITLPEASFFYQGTETEMTNLSKAHGMFADHFITDIARQRLLREVVGRCQRAVFDVTHQWKYGTVVSTDIVQLVHQIARHFEAPRPGRLETAMPTLHKETLRTGDNVFVSLSAADISSLVNALYLPRHPMNASSDRDAKRNGLHSSSSSISGFSLFQPPGTAMPIGGSTLSPQSADPETILSEKYPENNIATDVSQLDFGALEGEQLRDVCASIDDLLANYIPSASQDWCVLRLDVHTGVLSTVRDDLSNALVHEKPLDDTTEKAGDKHKSSNAVEDLLLDESLLQHWTTQGGYDLPLHNAHTGIVRAFTLRVCNCDEAGDFVGAHTWLRRMERYQKLVEGSSDANALPQFLTEIEAGNRGSLHRALGATQWCQEPLREVHTLAEFQHKSLCNLAETVSRIRDKMWYVAEARTSAAYDEARSVMAALKVMGRAKRSNGPRPISPLRHWTGSKGAATGFHLKTEAQVLEILSAPTGHGGPNKLSDDQSAALSAWMKRNAVENLCCGEERLQRLCLEIRKAVDTLTSDAAATWSSALFARGELSALGSYKGGSQSPLFSPSVNVGRFDVLALQTNVPPSINSISSASSHPLSARSSRDYLDTRSPTLTNKSSGPFWSPALTELQSPSSATSIGSSNVHTPYASRSNTAEATTSAGLEQMKKQVRQRVTSLLLSDLMLSTFATGSETDRAFWTGLGGELSEKHLRGLRRSHHVGSPDTIMPTTYRFDFDNAFGRLLQSFSTSCNPFVKLRYLADIDTLLKPYMISQASAIAHSRPELLRGHSLNNKDTTAAPDIMVEGFRRLFSNNQKRPSTIFRDLQYIAALVPSTTLSSTPEGKAFWNAAVAILGIKQEACQLMVETADSIIAHHSNNRGSGRASSTAQQERDSATFTAPSRTPSAEDIGKYTMAHAAELLQITAKEGDAVAQRELATLYLTHPELMDHIIAPLSRPRDVFKEELEGKWRKNQDPNRCDPATMCVAHHWMSLSSQGGDALAKEFLRQREEMDRLG